MLRNTWSKRVPKTTCFNDNNATKITNKIENYVQTTLARFKQNNCTIDTCGWFTAQSTLVANLNGGRSLHDPQKCLIQFTHFANINQIKLYNKRSFVYFRPITMQLKLNKIKRLLTYRSRLCQRLRIRQMKVLVINSNLAKFCLKGR